MNLYFVRNRFRQPSIFITIREVCCEFQWESEKESRTLAVMFFSPYWFCASIIGKYIIGVRIDASLTGRKWGASRDKSLFAGTSVFPKFINWYGWVVLLRRRGAKEVVKPFLLSFIHPSFILTWRRNKAVKNYFVALLSCYSWLLQTEKLKVK